MEKTKKVIITGGSGFLGSHLAKKLLEKGYSVVSLDIAAPQIEDVSFVEANMLAGVPEDSQLADPYSVINLAGKNIFGRWNDEFKELVYKTRVTGTKNLVQLFENERFRPEVFVSASAAGYYGDRGDEKLSVDSKPGDGFLARVSRDWESAAKEARRFGVSTSIIRNGHILGDGGLLGVLLPFYRLGLGGPLGSGGQWFPWIHIEDICNLYAAAIADGTEETVNAVAPDQVRNKEFSQALASVLSRPHIFRIPGWALRLLYGEFGEEMRFSQRIETNAPEVLDASFTYPKLRPALGSIVKST